jgi:HD-like signal output (HDOD) protein
MSEEKSFTELIKNYVDSGKVELPVFNTIALKIQNEIAKEDPDINRIEKFIINDQAITAEVLKFANSSFYSGLQQISSVKNAITRLGINEVSNIVTLVTHKNQFHSKNTLLNNIMVKLWRHSVGCAIGSHFIAKTCGLHQIKHEAFFAGLLHDVGKLLVLKVADDLNTKKIGPLGISNSLLSEAMVTLHSDFGFFLMKHWNFPEKYCEIAKQHHDEEWNQKNFLLAIVRLTNKACNKMGIGLEPDKSVKLFATEESKALNLSDIELANFEIYLEDINLGVSQVV